MIVLTGIIYGLGLALLIGPVFFALLKIGMRAGFRAGMYMALGISLSESFAVALVYLGISQLTHNAWFEFILGGAGGLLMIIFGLNTLIQNRKTNQKLKELERQELENELENNEENEAIITLRNSLLKRKKTKWQYIFDGFLLNAINPFVYIFWVGVVSSVITKYNYTIIEMIIFLITVILTVLCTDLLKVFFSKKLAHFLNVKSLSIMDKVIGIALIIFGIHLWFRLWTGMGFVH